jgi:nonsense-mediated mRNA decay protein 3
VGGMVRVCPVCGRTSDEVPFVGGLCRDCYIERVGVARLPSRIRFVYCKYCGSYKYQGGWNQGLGDPGETLVEYAHLVLSKKLKPTSEVAEAWIENVRLDKPFQGPGLYRLIVRVSGVSREGVELSQDLVVEARVDASVCPACTARLTERGFEAIVQVRGSEGRLGERLREEVEGFIEGLDQRLRGAIIKVDRVREGIDLYILDHASARMIAGKLRAAFMGKTIDTYKLVGRRPDGKRRGRLTISVRIPDIEPGDVLVVGGREALYIGRGRRGGLFVDMRTGLHFELDAETLWERGFRRHPGGEAERRLMLLSRAGGSYVFLDAESGYQRVVEYPREYVHVYTDRLVEGGVYRAFLVGRRLYIISPVEEASY